MTAAALLPESIRLARAAWDAATPATRVLFFLRSKRSALIVPTGDELDAIPFRSWDELPPETAYVMAWDVQFITAMLRGGRDALRASEGVSAPVVRVAA